MPSRQCNGGSQPAGWKSYGGKLWVPTARGLAVLDPRRMLQNPVVPPAHVESALVDGRAVRAKGRPLFPPGAQRIELHYTALSLAPRQAVLAGFSVLFTTAADVIEDLRSRSPENLRRRGGGRHQLRPLAGYPAARQPP